MPTNRYAVDCIIAGCFCACAVVVVGVTTGNVTPAAFSAMFQHLLLCGVRVIDVRAL